MFAYLHRLNISPAFVAAVAMGVQLVLFTIGYFVVRNVARHSTAAKATKIAAIATFILVVINALLAFSGTGAGGFIVGTGFFFLARDAAMRNAGKNRRDGNDRRDYDSYGDSGHGNTGYGGHQPPADTGSSGNVGPAGETDYRNDRRTGPDGEPY